MLAFWVSGLGLGFRVWGFRSSGFRSLWFGVWGSGLSVRQLECCLQGLEVGVQALGYHCTVFRYGRTSRYAARVFRPLRI